MFVGFLSEFKMTASGTLRNDGFVWTGEQARSVVWIPSGRAWWPECHRRAIRVPGGGVPPAMGVHCVRARWRDENLTHVQRIRK